MAKGLSAGDTVRVVERPQVPADVKSYMYYPHYAGLTGIVGKVYPDNTANVIIDQDSLPPAIRGRHEASTQSMRQKWLDSLSDEARNRLTAAEKKLSLRYAILVNVTDLLEAETGGTFAPVAKKIEPAAKSTSASATVTTESGRKTLEEIEAEEAQHLAEIAQRRAQDPSLDL